MERCITVHYQCLQCGAFDSDRFRADEYVPPMINCIKCHAGRDKDQAGMLHSKVGMRALSMDEAMKLRPGAFQQKPPKPISDSPLYDAMTSRAH